MVKVDSGESKASAVTSRLFLNSVKKWHEDDGVHCAISSVGKAVGTEREDRVSYPITIEIIDDMPKCRARVIGDDGKVVKVENDVGDEIDKIEIIKNPQEFTLWIKLAIEDAELDEYKCFSLASGFPLLNFAFAEAGDIEHSNTKNLIFTYDEMLDVLEGLEFRAFSETRNFKGGNKYPVLIPKAL